MIINYCIEFYDCYLQSSYYFSNYSLKNHDNRICLNVMITIVCRQQLFRYVHQGFSEGFVCREVYLEIALKIFSQESLAATELTPIKKTNKKYNATKEEGRC